MRRGVAGSIWGPSRQTRVRGCGCLTAADLLASVADGFPTRAHEICAVKPLLLRAHSPPQNARSQRCILAVSIGGFSWRGTSSAGCLSLKQEPSALTALHAKKNRQSDRGRSAREPGKWGGHCSGGLP